MTISNLKDSILEIAQALEKESVISFDTEFIRESTFFPIVEIIQVATRDKVWVIDVAPFKKGYPVGPHGSYDPILKPLLDVFQNPKILKIVHAAQGDQECLYTSYGITASPILDTAVAASLCGYGDNIGLGRLMKAVLDIDLLKGHARTDWSVRPLPDHLIEYAKADVERLVELGEKLLNELEKNNRKDWALTLSSRVGDLKNFELTPEEMALKICRGGNIDPKSFGVFVELMLWREKRVREVNIPRRWLADDSVLLDLARTRPKTIEHLASFRGLSKGEIKSNAEIILAAIKRGEENPRLAPPQKKKFRTPTDAEAHSLDLIKCFISLLAERHQVAVRHFATTQSLLPLLSEKILSVEDLIKHEIISAEAAHLVGDELLDFLHGKLSLQLKNGKIQIMTSS